jgi:transcriptional regulator with XRE-family HTH domain
MQHHPGAIIRLLRAQRDWTQAQLAQRIARSREQVARHEAGTQGVGPRTLARYAAAFGIEQQRFVEMCRGEGTVDREQGTEIAGTEGMPFFPQGIPAGDKRFFRPGELYSEHQLPRVLAEALRLPYPDVYAARVFGDSMEPTIRDGDVILLAGRPVQEQGVVSGQVYALWYNEHLESSGQLKRVKILPDGQWLAQSDNPRYPARAILPAALAGMDMYLGTVGLRQGTGNREQGTAGAEGGGGAETALRAHDAQTTATGTEQAAKSALTGTLQTVNGGLGPIRHAREVGHALKHLGKKRCGTPHSGT